MKSKKRSTRLSISAFGIHTGGGLVLLKSLVNAADPELRAIALDARTREAFSFPDSDTKITYVRRSFIARVLSVNRLSADMAQSGLLFCFNNLPPLRRSKGKVIVYVQNTLFDGTKSAIHYSFVTSIRIAVERLWFCLGIKNVDEIWVQTRLMADKMALLYPKIPVRIMPFVDGELFARLPKASVSQQDASTSYLGKSFIFPADGVAHKNHLNLVQAWRILEKSGKTPKLFLTLQRAEWKALTSDQHDPLPSNIENLGPLTRDQVLENMQVCSALIFPSLTESLGLPLIEAHAVGLPVIASERDFIRDVCFPSESFDPCSPRSISMAVERFVEDIPPMLNKNMSAKQFVNCLLKQ